MSIKNVLRNFRVNGLCCAPCTPFKSNGDVNIELIKEYVNHMVAFGVPNIFVNGTTGEGNSMTIDERKKATETWLSEAKGKLSSIIVQIGANNLRESQDLARHAESVGAHAIACVGTVFYKPQTIDDYVTYMKEVASAAPKSPFILYDIDFVTGIQFDAYSFFKLAQETIPTLCGIKHTSPNFVSINNTKQDFPDFQTMLGSDEMYLQGLAIGVDITIMNSYMGHVLNRLKEAYDKGDIQEARKQQGYALAVGKIRRKHGLSIAQGTKVILQLCGLPVGSPRLPLSDITPQLLQAVKEDLTEAGFFEWALH